MQEKILSFLKRKEGYISGEELSHHLKVSRQALWKHIQELRDAGYDIIAVPHLGYKLASSPDRLFPVEIQHDLNTRIFGRKIHYSESLSSTMDAAFKLGMEGAEEGTLVLTETQTKGRGRHGRTWASPKYKGIYFSPILRPKIPPAQTPVLTLLAAVSICEAVKEEGVIGPKIKWPNDIILGNKKVGGILTELNAEMDEVHFVVIGIGLNVNGKEDHLPAGATSLEVQVGRELSRRQILQKLIQRLEANYIAFRDRGPDFITEKWRKYALTLGKRVKINYPNGHLEGTAVDIDSDGALLVRKDSGITQKVTSGDVVHCR